MSGPWWRLKEFHKYVSVDGTDRIEWLLIGTTAGGLAAALLVLVLADEGVHPSTRMLRCAMGFFVAIVWIMAIADEVVRVLQVRYLTMAHYY